MLGDVRGTALLSGAIIDLGCNVISMAKQEKLLWIATMDRMVCCYSQRGKRIKSIVLTEDVSEITVLSIKRSKINYLLIIAQTNGLIRLFKEGISIMNISIKSPIIAMRYGSYGREENSLIIIHGNHELSIKIWKRTVDIDSINSLTNGPPTEQDIPLVIPKKTKLYVEQSQREREQAPAIHRAFHKDLCRLRLETARSYVKTLTEGYMVSYLLHFTSMIVYMCVTMFH